MATQIVYQTTAEVRNTLSTTMFQFATGKHPRGIGNWVFEITYRILDVEVEVTELVNFRGLYTQAVNQVVGYALRKVFYKNIKIARITVCP